VTLRAGEETLLPINKGYDAVTLASPAEVHCVYSKAVPGAVESIERLKSDQPRDFISFDEAAAVPPDAAPTVIARAWSSIKNFFTA